MTNEELNTALYKKVFAEQEKYREWLLSQPPNEILNHCYEYTVREDIVLALEEYDLSDKQCKALLKSPSPLADVFKDFEKRETDHMDNKRRSNAKIGKFKESDKKGKSSKPLSLLDFFGGVGGIRTHGPLRIKRFRVVLVMTTSIPLRVCQTRSEHLEPQKRGKTKMLERRVRTTKYLVFRTHENP